jgi:hypothetical protein
LNGLAVVALVTGGSAFGGGEDEEAGLWAAIAGLRAVLERGGRVLLTGESPQVIAMLMAAAEYQELRAVETGEENAPSPVILGPLARTDALEDELLTQRQLGEGEGGGGSLLEELGRSGLYEDAAERDADAPPGRAFRAALDRWRPRAVLAMGGGLATAPLLDAAEGYREEGARPVRLLRAWPAEGQIDNRGWNVVERYTERERGAPQPMLDGEVIGEGAERPPWDERLMLLVRRAAAEASLALAIDRTVGELLGSGESGPLAGGDRGHR